MSNTKVVLAAQAQRDLRGVLRHTRKEWGETQWAKTAARFERAFQHLSAFPNSGVSRHFRGIEIQALFRSPFVILYRVDFEEVRVLRIGAQRRLRIVDDSHEEWQSEDD
ncbi:MAG: type II toxin-antitoxin system RelE/ParE family toxin [Thermomicrobiales bacterium]